MTTYDSWLTTPPDESHINDHAEEDALERAYDDHMQALQVWIDNATGRQIKVGVKLMEEAIRQRIADAAAELKALGAGNELPRAPRKDKGKPRAPRTVEMPANEIIYGEDPFAEAK